MKLLRRLLGIAIFLAILVGGWRFATENGTPVTIHYLAGELVDVALWAVILASFAGGVAATALYSVYQQAKFALASRRYRKTVHGLEAEVHQLRNLPLSTEDRMGGESASEAALGLPSAGARERGA
jgi:uncharacterized integral membrane protein